MEALTDSAFRQLCALIEDAEDRLHPDAVAYSGDLAVYRHLVDLGALSLGDGIGVGILCPWCGGVDLADVRCDQSRYRGYCTDCGRVDLAPEQVRPWRLELNRIVRWLASALGLNGRFQIEERVLMGDTARERVWNELGALLDETWTHESGVPLPLARLALDTGFATQEPTHSDHLLPHAVRSL